MYIQCDILRFSWDDSKNSANKRKHGFGFEEAITIFNGTEEIEYDHEHSTDNEDRFRAYGRLHGRLPIVVVFVDASDDLIRIISAFKE